MAAAVGHVAAVAGRGGSASHAVDPLEELEGRWQERREGERENEACRPVEGAHREAHRDLVPLNPWPPTLHTHLDCEPLTCTMPPEE